MFRKATVILDRFCCCSEEKWVWWLDIIDLHKTTFKFQCSTCFKILSVPYAEFRIQFVSSNKENEENTQKLKYTIAYHKEKLDKFLAETLVDNEEGLVKKVEMVH